MVRLATVPAGRRNASFGVRRPSRAVSLDDARNPEAANRDERWGFTAAPAPVDEGWLSPASEESLGTAWNVVRPFQLQDVGLGGLPGQIPIPIPGSGAIRGVGRGIAKGAGKSDDAVRGFLNWLRRGDDVVDEVADLTQPMLPNMGGVPRVTPTPAPSGRPTIRMQHGQPRPNTVARPGAAQPELLPPSGPGLAATGRGPARGTRPTLDTSAGAKAAATDPATLAAKRATAQERYSPIDPSGGRPIAGGARVSDEVMTISTGHTDRVAVLVQMPDGSVMPFYRRTGTGDLGRPRPGAQQGDWVAFEGLQELPGGLVGGTSPETARKGFGRGWFIKPEEIGAGGLRRWGTPEMQEIGQSLKALDATGALEPNMVVRGIEEANVLLRQDGMGGLRGLGHASAAVRGQPQYWHDTLQIGRVGTVSESIRAGDVTINVSKVKPREVQLNWNWHGAPRGTPEVLGGLRPGMRELKRVADELTAEGITVTAAVDSSRPELLRAYRNAGFEVVGDTGWSTGGYRFLRRLPEGGVSAPLPPPVPPSGPIGHPLLG